MTNDCLNRLRSLGLALLLCCVASSVPAAGQLQGVVDIHVHSAPDSGPRNVDAIEVARIAQRHGVRAILLKNHYTHTASLAYIVRQAVPGVEAYGGIALNRSVGGINPIAVEHMALTTGRFGRVVWMPTFDSEHYTRTLMPNPNFVPISRGGKLLPEVHEVLAVMVRENLALATGHSSPEESLLLVRAAKEAGIGRIVVTHPHAAAGRDEHSAAEGSSRHGSFFWSTRLTPRFPGATSSLKTWSRPCGRSVSSTLFCRAIWGRC